MGQFSQANATATCSALSDKAHSMVVQAQRVLQAARDESGDQDLYQSHGMLSARLQQLGHHANQLGYLISDATVVHSQLGNILQSGLAECQNALTVVSDGLETGGDGTYDRNAVASYLSFVGAFVSLFVLGDQLLIM
jgi:ABC-type nickel/cobalt efflux system permease component RcnA